MLRDLWMRTATTSGTETLNLVYKISYETTKFGSGQLANVNLEQECVEQVLANFNMWAYPTTRNFSKVFDSSTLPSRYLALPPLKNLHRIWGEIKMFSELPLSGILMVGTLCAEIIIGQEVDEHEPL